MRLWTGFQTGVVDGSSFRTISRPIVAAASRRGCRDAACGIMGNMFYVHNSDG